jgi:hypothetical protein
MLVSRPGARLRKARITIQISPSGRLSVLVRTRMQLIWKLSIWLQPSGRAHNWYGNCMLKFSRPDVHPPWSGRVKPYMEITCSGHETARKSVSHRPDAALKQERFLAKFLKYPVAQLSVRTASVHITAVAHSAPQPINRGPWALRTARLRYWIPQERKEVQDPSEAVTSVLRYIWSLS